VVLVLSWSTKLYYRSPLYVSLFWRRRVNMIQFIPMILGIPFFGFWFWMIIDLTNNPYLSKQSKNNWFLAFVLLNIFGAFWYYMVEYRNRNL